MRLLAFSRRNLRELVRDPLTLLFGAGFPVAVLLLMTAIQSHIPVALFQPERLTPGIAVFGQSLLTLFSATTLARDRESAFLARLYTTPLTAAEFLLGYLLPILPLALLQSLLCYGTAAVLGLPVTVRMASAAALTLPCALFFIAMGLLCGSLFTVKQVGSLCGALLTNLCAWLSGAWFDLELVGGVLRRIAYALPFVHGVELQRAALAGDLPWLLPHLPWILGYGAATMAVAIWAFVRQMRSL